MADMLKASWEELKTVADAAYRAENYKRAFDLYTTILEKHKDELGHDDALQIRGNRGLASQKQGDGLMAVDDACKVVQSAALDVKSWFRLGISLLTAKCPAEAISALEMALTIEPENKDAQAKLKKAKQLLKAAGGKSGGPYQSEAENEDFRKCVRNTIQLAGMIPTLYCKGKQAQATNGAAKTANGSASVGHTTDAKRPGTPETGPQKAKRPSSSSTNASTVQAESPRANGTATETQQDLPQPETPEDQAEKHKAQGTQKYKAGDWSGAVEAYGKAIEATPGNAVLYANRAAASLMKGDYMQALNDGKTAIAKDPKFARGYHRAAKAYLTMGKFSQAKENFNQALELDKKDQAAKDGLGLISRLQSHLEAGSKSLESNDARQGLWHADLALRETTPACEPALFLRAKALALLGRHSEALSESRNLTFEGNSTSTEALIARGQIFYIAGNLQMAEKAFQQVLRMDPDCSAARKSLRQARAISSAKEAGNEAFKNRKWHEAMEQYTTAIETDPLLNNTFISQCYANRCAAALNLNMYEKAVEDADKAVELDESNVKAIFRRGTANLKLQNYEAAVRDFEKVKDLAPDMAGVGQSLKEAKLELKKSKRVDYYKLLGVSPNATTEEIKKAYKKAALKNHPDKVPAEERDAAEKRFQQINNGNTLLTDEKKRAQYDDGWTEEEIAQGMQEGMGMGGFGGGMGGGIDPEILAQLFGQRGGGGFGFSRGFHGGF